MSYTVTESAVPAKFKHLRPSHTPYKPKPFNSRPFIAWDSEGYTDPITGEHKLMLFGCSTGDRIIGRNLTNTQCFDLMLSVAAKTKGVHVIYAGGYDFIMMLRFYPPAVAERIIKGSVTWYQGYRHEYRKGKYFRLSNGRQSIHMYDVFSFFATSFVKACREYLGSSEDLDRIEAVKIQRSTFTLESVQELVVPYWEQELKYLVELCTVLRQRLHDAGIDPKGWHGPGAVATSVLSKRGMKAYMKVSPPDVVEAARYAYYGGRFEQYKVGQAHQQCHQYDIRSAYPFAISRLPNLAGLTWRHRIPNKPVKRVQTFGIYKVSYQSHSNVGLDVAAPFPWRAANGNIYYPHDLAEGWYWGIEVDTAMQIAPGVVTVLEGWEPTTTVFDTPFSWIADMYEDRATMKRNGDPTQLALKLALNSIYGKLAQSKGAKQIGDNEWRLPTYHQLEWAGWITAASRAKLYQAIVQAGSHAIAVETDAIYSEVPLDLPIGERLGEWEYDVLQDIMYIQSGVYFKQTEKGWILKSRGFEPRNHTYERWAPVMAQLPQNPTATVTQTSTRFGAVAGRANFARWYEQTRTSDILSLVSKRVHFAEICQPCLENRSFQECFHKLVVPQVYINADTEPSAPHKLPWIGDDFEAWAEELIITEEGYIALDFDTVQEQ